MAQEEWKVRHPPGISKRCKDFAERHLPADKYEVKRAIFIHPNRCLIDFKRKQFEPDMNCEEYCEQTESLLKLPEQPEEETEEALKECMESCKENLETAATSSVHANLETQAIDEATIAGSCEHVWMSEMEEEPEKWEEESEKVKEDFRKLGCEVKDAWIHPHEIAGTAEWEEYPAVCYFHVQRTNQNCKLPDVLKKVEKIA